MAKKTDVEIAQEAARITMEKFRKALSKRGATLEKAALRIAQALDAKETKTLKVKGAVEKGKNRRLKKASNIRVVAETTGETATGGTEEHTVLQWDEIPHKLRMDAALAVADIFDAKPSTKVDASVDASLTVELVSYGDKQPDEDQNPA